MDSERSGSAEIQFMNRLLNSSCHNTTTTVLSELEKGWHSETKILIVGQTVDCSSAAYFWLLIVDNDDTIWCEGRLYFEVYQGSSLTSSCYTTCSWIEAFWFSPRKNVSQPKFAPLVLHLSDCTLAEEKLWTNYLQQFLGLFYDSWKFILLKGTIKTRCKDHTLFSSTWLGPICF